MLFASSTYECTVEFYRVHSRMTAEADLQKCKTMPLSSLKWFLFWKT